MNGCDGKITAVTININTLKANLRKTIANHKGT